jgi:hypothetical protein
MFEFSKQTCGIDGKRHTPMIRDLVLDVRTVFKATSRTGEESKPCSA